MLTWFCQMQQAKEACPALQFEGGIQAAAAEGCSSAAGCSLAGEAWPWR